MKRIILLMVLIMGGLSYSNDYAGDAAVYLRMGLGARAVGMGGAFVGLADDSTAAYWNPAGLIQLEKSEVSLMYSALSLDRRYNFLNYAQPLTGDSALALSIINFGVGDLEERTGATKDPIGKFTDSENTLLVSYAKAFKKISYGGNLKVLYQSMDPSSGKKSGEGWGLDIACLTNPANNVYAGLIIQDIGSYLKWDTGHTDKLPLDIRAGLCVKLLDKKLNLCADIEKIEERDNVKAHLGAEYLIGDRFAIRAGLNSKDPTAGCSLNLPFSGAELGLHYAFSPDTFTAFDDDKGFTGDKYSHRVSLTIGF
ncbi:PorV/PorQ family protein [bacterium]|nr:PorV/PorQ family protein [bacterium]